jgi:hypothetical protein
MGISDVMRGVIALTTMAPIAMAATVPIVEVEGIRLRPAGLRRRRKVIRLRAYECLRTGLWERNECRR